MPPAPLPRPIRRHRALSDCVLEMSNFAPSRREIVFSPATNPSGANELPPDRDCDTAVAKCGKTSMMKTREVECCGLYRATAPIVPPQAEGQAQMRTQCRRCDLISAATQMPRLKAHRSAGARHDRKPWS